MDVTNPLSVVVFIHHGSRAGKLNARTNRRPFFIFRFSGPHRWGVFLFAVVAYVLNHTNIVGLAINAGLVGLGIWAIVTWLTCPCRFPPVEVRVRPSEGR
ncbi:hypothetical protein, partial [Bradyrhizobium sp. 38]